MLTAECRFFFSSVALISRFLSVTSQKCNNHFLCFALLFLYNVPVTVLNSLCSAPKVRMFTVFFNVIKTESFFSLWKGVSPVSN